MKELTIEEKTKAYNKVREKIAIRFGSNVADEIFSEYEDNKDEKIRKALIRFHRSTIDIDGIKGEDIIAWLEKQKEPEDKGEISDGYHTFNELYYYRMLYNAAFFNTLPKEWVHKSKKHHDGEECFGGGWFIVMAKLPTGQVSNHYELKDWDLFQIPEKETSDEWDGHTPQEAAERLHKYLLEKQDEQKPVIFRAKDWYISKVDGKIHNIMYNPTEKKEQKEIDQKHITEMKSPEESLGISSKEHNEIVNDCLYGESTPIEEVKQQPIEHQNEEELSDFEAALFSAFSDGWQQYLNGEEIDFAQWAKEHSAELLEAANQNHIAWSEEDEKYRIAAIELVTHCVWGSFGGLYRETVADWLKSLKPQPKQVWSEEDETNLKRVEFACMKFFGGDTSLIGWLRKTIKRRLSS